MLKKLKNYHYYIYLGFTAFIFFIYLQLPRIGDDVANYNAKGLHTLTGILTQNQQMFFTWSSRVIINPFMIGLNTLTPHWIFALVTALLTTCILLGINQLFNLKNNWKKLGLAMLVLLTYPLIQFSTAGWIATSVTYLWPLGTLGLAIRLLALKKPAKNYFLPIILLLLLFTFNNEQLCISGILILAWQLVLKKKAAIKSYWPYLIAIIPNILLLIFAPGNAARKIAETKRWYPEFAHFNLIQKVDLGAVTTIQHYLFGLSLPIILLALVVFLMTYKKHPIISWVPIIELMVTNGLILLSSNPMRFAATINPTFSKTTITTYVLGIIFIGSLFYLIHDLSINYILFVAILSRVAMGFSPTIYASATRTFSCCDFLILAVVIYLITVNKYKINAKILLPILLTMVGFSFIANYALISNWQTLQINQLPLIDWKFLMKR